ncbi:hypothetical protein [Jonesia quinghaiensis]|uniref:hypothetical protein n=1 Tax=Jonesia quinghaiensis TaxID=262806 RepID=UPI0003FD0F32|nr:hypothetical protein [Jonesia quinghaiensis]
MTLTVTATLPPLPAPPALKPLPEGRPTPRMSYRELRALLPELDAPGTFSATAFRHSSALIFTPESVGGELAWQDFIREGWLSCVTEGYAIPSKMIESPGTRARIARIHLQVSVHEVVAMESASWVHCGGPMPAHGTIIYRTFDPTPRRRTGVTRKRTSLRGTDTVNVAGVQVTSVERTLYDLAHGHQPDAFFHMVQTLDIDSATLTSLITRIKGTYKHFNSAVALRRVRELMHP